MVVVVTVEEGFLKITGLLDVKVVVTWIAQSLMSQVSSHPIIGKGVMSAISENPKYVFTSASVVTNL